MDRHRLVALEMLARWTAYLTAPVDAASVAVFRIVFGLMMAWDASRYLAYGWVDEYYVLPKMHLTYYLFEFVRPWPGVWMHAHFYVLTIAGVLVGLGLAYRAAAVVLFLGYTYVFLLEASVYMNHHYLMCLLAFLLIWIPADRAYSLDRWWRPDLPRTVPQWAVSILRFQLLVVYFYGALAKLNPDWLRGEPMYSAILRHDPDVPASANLLPPALIAYGIAYGGILADLGIPLLLMFSRTVLLGFAFATVFHLANEIFLNIGVFSFLMTGAITIFFAPDWPRRLARRIGWESAAPAPVPLPSARCSRLPLLALAVYAAFQLLFPLRRFLYPGSVSWTEQGHRFSWHMKLREKRSILKITATDPATGRTWVLDPEQDLLPRQAKKVETFPDALLQYAHYHRDRLRQEGVADPVITVDWLCSLNGRPFQRLIDPTANLAVIEDSWRPAKWILPLDESNGSPPAPVQDPHGVTNTQ